MHTLKIFKKIVKVFLWILVGVFGLILLLCILVYLPPVQKFAVGKVTAAVSQSTGMELTVERFRLRFPLGVSVDGATLLTPAGDTLAGFERLKVDVGVLPLLAGDVRARGISLQHASSSYRDTVSATLVQARIERFTVRSATLGLRTHSVRISRAALQGANVRLEAGEGSPKPDTATVDTASTAWKFSLRRFDLSDVDFAMNTSPQPSALTVGLPQGVIRGAGVDLGTRVVDVQRIRLTQADYGYFTGAREDRNKAAPGKDAEADTLPWSIDVGRVELSGNRAAYGSMYGAPAAGLDLDHIRADSIEILVEDIHFRGSELSARLQRLELTERSGLRIRRGKGDFTMTENGLSLDGFDLATENSEIRADAEVGSGIMDMSPYTPVRATIGASVGMADISLLVPVDAAARRALRGQSLRIDGDLNGTLGDLSINRLAAAMSGHIDFDAYGTIRSIDRPADLAGDISFEGTLRNMDFAKNFIADTAVRRKIGFPARMSLSGEAAFSPDVYELSRLTLAADTGRLDLNARLGVRSEDFAADAAFTDFPLYSFLPHDSLGVATLTLHAVGRGFDPFGGMSADIQLDVDRLDYLGFAYHDIELSVALEDNSLEGRLTSSNEALSLDLGFDGTIEQERLEAELYGDVWRADLHRMGFSQNTLAITTQLDISGAALRDSTRMRFTLDAEIDSTVVRIGETAQRINRTSIEASTGDSLTSATVRTGDLNLDFSSPLPVDSLITEIGSLGEEIKRQLAARNLSVDSLQNVLPDMRLTLDAGRGNVLRDLARAENLDFRKVTADISTVNGSPLHIEGEVNGLVTAGLTLDTLSLRVSGRDDRLTYALRLANRPGNVESLALIWIYGTADGKEASLNVYQRNRADSVGFRFGLNAQLLENSVKATLVPQNPTLGYEQWSVNDGNYVTYDFDRKFYADLRLDGPSAAQHFYLTSASLPDIPEGALRLDMAGIDIGTLLDLLPTAPPLGGVVSSDLVFGLTEGGTMAAEGTLAVDDFMYNRRRVADIDARLDFQSDSTGRMSLDAGVDIEKRTALTAKGYYTEEDMNFTVQMPYVPLGPVGAFLPEGTAKLSGSLDGNLNITGPPADPDINGDIGFSDARAEIEMVGTTYGISDRRITVSGGIVDLDGFGITAPNDEKLSIDGTVDISDPGNMKADLVIAARNFEAVNSDHIGGSQVYGKVELDLDLTARGPFDGLTVRGDVDLLSTTDVVYILRNQSDGVQDTRQHIVEFMVFADSLYTASLDTVPRFRKGAMDLLVGVNIDDGVKATLALDEQNENRIELEGSGELTFSMNTQGDMRLTGRYTLSGGKVYYRPPAISQKVFTVQDGSYVEWTGEPADPQFNVTATLTQKTTLTSSGGASKDVSFNITIAVSGSLQGIDITFDLAAPGDLEIQNELSAMSAEERMQQALTLLIYNQYTGLAYSSEGGTSFDARDQVNQFISREINQWARNNLKGVDFSLGIANSEDEYGNSYTDYSYSVSKNLFSDRVKVTVGGSVSDNSTSQNFSDNLLEDITLEYRLTKRDNMFLKLYRYDTQESILEGEVTETGGGFLMRKKMNRLGDLFRINRDEDRKRSRVQRREDRRELREQEKSAGDDEKTDEQTAPPPGDPSDPARLQRQGTPVLQQGSDGGR